MRGPTGTVLTVLPKILFFEVFLFAFLCLSRSAESPAGVQSSKERIGIEPRDNEVEGKIPERVGQNQNLELHTTICTGY